MSAGGWNNFDVLPWGSGFPPPLHDVGYIIFAFQRFSSDMTRWARSVYVGANALVATRLHVKLYPKMTGERKTLIICLSGERGLGSSMPAWPGPESMIWPGDMATSWAPFAEVMMSLDAQFGPQCQIPRPQLVFLGRSLSSLPVLPGCVGWNSFAVRFPSWLSQIFICYQVNSSWTINYNGGPPLPANSVNIPWIYDPKYHIWFTPPIPLPVYMHKRPERRWVLTLRRLAQHIYDGYEDGLPAHLCQKIWAREKTRLDLLGHELGSGPSWIGKTSVGGRNMTDDADHPDPKAVSQE